VIFVFAANRMIRNLQNCESYIAKLIQMCMCLLQAEPFLQLMIYVLGSRFLCLCTV
jgi:hypothetical protein